MAETNKDRTLQGLISEAFCKGIGKEKFGKNKKSQAAAAEKLATWFSDYYGGTDHEDARINILDQKVSRIKATLDEFRVDLTGGIQSYPHDKYQLTLRIEHLIKHLNRDYGLNLDLQFFDNLKTRDRYDRLLKIIKHLHSGNHSRKDLSETFAISKRALSDDLNTLLDGFEFMGTTMKISELERGSNTYSSLIHPVFLALNTAEIYAMTIGLKLLAEDTIFGDDMNRISDNLYAQLSSHARSMVEKQAELDDLRFEDKSDRKFINSMEFIKQEQPFSYYLKDATPCKVVVRSDGLRKELSGTLQLAPEGSNRFKKITLVTSSEKLVLGIDEIISIVKL